MNASDVMVGDWVTILRSRENGSDRNVRVNGMNKDVILAPGQWENESGCQPYEYTQIAPIPLTPEILEKNAPREEDATWWCFGDFYVARLWDGYVLHQSREDDKRDFLCHIHFVHELQRALRLCGLNDMANDFKI